MSRRPRAPLQPTLLPFLAVLVCTLGTLILLLAIVAQDSKSGRGGNAEIADVQPVAAEPAVAEPAAAADPDRFTAAAADALIAGETFRLTELVSHRDAQTAELEKRREMQTHLEESFRVLRRRRDQLVDEVAAATGAASVGQAAAEDLQAAEARITQLTETIESLTKQDGRGRSRVVIVPYAGRNGTSRRPIYIECTAEAAVLWPEGIGVPINDLRRAMADRFRVANPIDEALRITRLHLVQKTGDPSPPYPLLVVRPGGIATYNATRAAMGQWDDQFGYELLDDDVELETGQADPALHRRLTELVAHASARLDRSIGRVVIGGGRGRGGNGSGDSGAGEFDRPDPTTGAGGFGGGGVIDPPGGEETADRVAGSGRVGSGLTAGGAASSRSQRSPGGRRTRPRVLSAANLDQQAASNGYRGASFTAGGGSPYTAGGDSGQRTGRPTSGSSIDDLVDQYRQSGGRSGGGTADSESAAGQDGTPGPSDAVASDGQPFGQPVGGRIQAATGVQNRNGSPPGGTQSAASSAAAPPPGAAAPPGGAGASAQSTPPPAVDPSQLRWALPREFAGGNGTAVVRPVTLTLRNDRMELTEAGRVIETIDLSRQPITDATLHLAGRVQQRVRSWGTTLPGGRWVPRLEVTVAPHADGRFEQLQRLMDGSGVEVHRRP